MPFLNSSKTTDGILAFGLDWLKSKAKDGTETIGGFNIEATEFKFIKEGSVYHCYFKGKMPGLKYCHQDESKKWVDDPIPTDALFYFPIDENSSIPLEKCVGLVLSGYEPLKPYTGTLNFQDNIWIPKILSGELKDKKGQDVPVSMALEFTGIDGLSLGNLDSIPNEKITPRDLTKKGGSWGSGGKRQTELERLQDREKYILEFIARELPDTKGLSLATVISMPGMDAIWQSLELILSGLTPLKKNHH